MGLFHQLNIINNLYQYYKIQLILLNHHKIIDFLHFSYTYPRINSVSTEAQSDNIWLEVSSTNGTNPIDEYCYSINGGSYNCRSYDFYTFSGLSENVTYSIRIYAVDTEGHESNVYTVSATTRYVSARITSGISISTDTPYVSFYYEEGESPVSKATCEITLYYDGSVRTYTENVDDSNGWWNFYIPRDWYESIECWLTDENGRNSNTVTRDNISQD